MSTRSELKQVRALQQKKYRDQDRLFLVQGEKLVQEALASKARIKAIYASESIAGHFNFNHIEVLPLHELERLGTLESGNEVIAVVHMPDPAGAALLSAGTMALALDGIADPGNLGTILRVADWFGIDQVICSTGSVDAFNPKCVQASMGAIFRVNVSYGDLVRELTGQHARGAHLYMASMEGRKVFDVRVRRPCILVMGSEAHGLSDAMRSLPGDLVSVPGSGRSESLNVATATAALCMEFERQRLLP